MDVRVGNGGWVCVCVCVCGKLEKIMRQKQRISLIDYGGQYLFVKINKRGVGIRASWVENFRKINKRVGTIIRYPRVVTYFRE
jgi:hypothetical protein